MTQSTESQAGQTGHTSDDFEPTRWSLVLRAQAGPETAAFDALNTLCEIYWYPLYAYIRRTGRQPAEAEDLTQGYFRNLLDRNYLARASEEKGKLRAFLLADVKLFLSNERRRANALKRGGGQIFVPVDRQWAEEHYTHEPVDEVTPAQLFDRRWAMTLLGRVMEKVSGKYAEKGREDLFDALKQFISWNAGGEPYSEVAKRLGRDENYVKQNVHRLRKFYRKTLEEEVAQTVDSAEDVAEEIRDLAAALI